MIRRRLTAAVVAIVAVVILLSGLATVATLEQRLVADIDNQLREVPESIDSATARDLRRQLGPGVIDVRQVAFIRLGPEGTIIGSVPSGASDDPDPLPDVSGLGVPVGPVTVDSVEEGGPRYRVVTSTLPDGGTLVTGMSLADVDGTVADARQILLVAGLAALAVVALAASFAIRRGLAPVDRMIESAQRIAEGNITERVAVANPESEVGQLGTALNRMLDRLEDAFAARAGSEERMRRFVADASHELRTPLTAIRGYAELYGTSDDPEERAQAMGRVQQAAVRMGGLIDDLVLLARLDQGRPLANDLVDMTRIVEDAAADARTISNERQVDVRTTGRTTFVTGDRARLRQIVDNLLANVREHTPAGTNVELNVSTEGDQVVVAVADDGPGMTVEEVTRAFDRFWQGPATDAHPRRGTGLGLAIVSDLVKAHGGTIRLDSAPGVGTLVTIRLPYVGADSQETPSWA
jgi:two-component system, OmpR family, sensor kinase